MARKGFAGVEGLPARPHLRWRPWVLDPAFPNDPTKGAWGVWQWRMDVAMLDFTAGLGAMPAADGRGSEEIRTDLYAFSNLPNIELKDVDGVTYSAKMTAFRESLAEPYDLNHPKGGWVAQVEFALV